MGKEEMLIYAIEQWRDSFFSKNRKPPKHIKTQRMALWAQRIGEKTWKKVLEQNAIKFELKRIKSWKFKKNNFQISNENAIMESFFSNFSSSE